MAHGYNNERDPLLSTSGSFSSLYGSSRCSAPPLYLGNGVPALPEGKTHHLFFSHSSDDQQWVQACVEQLEQNSGIRCLWPPRDFIAGKPIINLIEDGMSRSMKIVIVLSPEYIDSGWCSYERHLAFVLSVQERQNCIIPVMLKPCLVPDVLRTVNYIDVTKGENAEYKITNALYTKCELKDILPNFTREYHQEEVNGANMSIEAQKEVASNTRGTAWVFPSLSFYQHEQLKNMGSQISRDTYELATMRINSLVYMRRFALIRFARPLQYFIFLSWSMMFFLSWIFLFCIMISIDMSSSLWTMIIPIVGFSLLGFVLIYVSCGILIRMIVEKTGKEKAQKIAKELSLQSFQQTKLFISFHQLRSPMLSMRYYDTKPCQLYIRDCFLRLYAASPEDAEKEELASNVAAYHIRQFVDNNYQRIMEWNFKESPVQRHATVLGKQCLCEMIEEDLWPPQIIDN